MSSKRIMQFLVLLAILAGSLGFTGSASAYTCSSYITVQWGDTLSGIAQQCGTTVQAIRAANPGLGWWVYAGQVLYIPTGGYNPGPQYPSSGGTYVVQWGDTLGKIAARIGVSWRDILAVNPQIQNPHWIYPGDRIRLREAGAGPTVGHVGFSGRRSVPPQTVFLRDVGWIDDRKEDTWGTVVGSPSDKRLLSYGDVIYVQLEDDHDVGVGSDLTIFKPIRSIDSDRVKGELVSIRGTAKIDRFNAKTKMARARIVESIDVIVTSSLPFQ